MNENKTTFWFCLVLYNTVPHSNQTSMNICLILLFMLLPQPEAYWPSLTCLPMSKGSTFFTNWIQLNPDIFDRKDNAVLLNLIASVGFMVEMVEGREISFKCFCTLPSILLLPPPHFLSIQYTPNGILSVFHASLI